MPCERRPELQKRVQTIGAGTLKPFRNRSGTVPKSWSRRPLSRIGIKAPLGVGRSWRFERCGLKRKGEIRLKYAFARCVSKAWQEVVGGQEFVEILVMRWPQRFQAEVIEDE